MIRRLGSRLGWTASGVRKAPPPFRYGVLENISGERTFAKTYPAHAREEFLRGRVLFETGQRTGLFRAPQPLELFETRNIIMWEYLDDLVESRDYVLEQTRRSPSKQHECADLFFSSGRALAAIHEGLLEVPHTGEFSPIPEIHSGNDSLDQHVASELRKCPRRPLHWDFCCGNLFVTRDTSTNTTTLVILDAMPNHYVLQKSGPNVVSPIYVDIAQMIFSLCCHPGFSRALGGAADGYVAQFLAGYSRQAGRHLDHATAFACAEEITRIYQGFRDGGATRFSLGLTLDRRFRMAAGRRLHQAALQSLQSDGPVDTRRTPEPLAKADGLS